MFGEGQGRILVSVSPSKKETFEQTLTCAFEHIGEVGGKDGGIFVSRRKWEA